MVTEEWTAQHIAKKRLKPAQIIEIPGAGHSPYFEDAATWNKIVLEFLTQHHC